MTMKERIKMIDEIVDQVDDWDLDELIEYVKEYKRDKLGRGSDTLVQLEWEEWCAPD